MRARAVAVFMVLGVVVAAFTTSSYASGGSSGGSSDAAPTTTAAAGKFPPVNQPGVTDTEIRVGGVTSKTNPLGGAYGDGFAGTQAYFDMINSQGGIYGRKLVLSSKRDDQVGNNRSDVQGLVSEDNVFAVAPVEVLLFSGADLLEKAGIPTFGWNINAEWGSEQHQGQPNMFTDKGYLCFTCDSNVTLPWLAKKLKAKNLGVLAYTVPQSSDCVKGIQASLKKYPTAKVAFVDSSLSFGVTDLSGDVSQMINKKVDLVTTCMDNNGVLTLAREMKKQGLNAPQYLPNAYDQKFMQQNGQFFQGSYLLTYFSPFEAKPQPPGIQEFLKWMKKNGSPTNENSLIGWVDANMLVTGLKAAGPDFTRQKVIDALNKETNFTADGILGGINWTVQHTGDNPEGCIVISKVDNGKFVPSFGAKGKPFLCFPSRPATLPAKPTLKS